MPPNESLETTKRKFYKLLENFSGTRVDRAGNASSTTLAEPASKRSRFLRSRSGERSERTRPVSMPPAVRQPHDPDITALADGLPEPVRKEFLSRADLRFLAGERRRRVQAEEEKNAPPLKYAPHHQPAFLERLKTFADIKVWTPKPEAVGEVAWARRGWICQGRDTVFCRACENRLVVGLRRNEEDGATEGDADEVGWWTEEARTKLVEKYKGLVIDGHDASCAWRDHGSREDIFHMKMADPNIWQPELKARYQSLIALSTTMPDTIALPSNTEDAPVKFDLERMVKALADIVLDQPKRDKENQVRPESGNDAQQEAEDAAPNEDRTPKVDDKALALALCGWSGQKTTGVELAQCSHCFQRCGLWLYTSSPGSKTLSSLTTTTPGSSMAFDPIDLHRAYCPWKNATTQAATGTFKGLNGWQIELSLAEFVAERMDRHEKQRLLDLEDERGEYEERTWDDIMAFDRQQAEKEREFESRMARIKRAFTFKKPSSRLQKKRAETAKGGIGAGDANGAAANETGGESGGGGTAAAAPPAPTPQAAG